MKKYIGRRIVRLEKVGSTNELGLSPSFLSYPSGTVIIAKEQTKGKGRRNRVWHSDRGGIYMSIVFNDVNDYMFFYKLALLSAFAVREVLSEYTRGDLYVKWPNDIYYEDRKICGILLQSTSQGERNRIVVGIGVNINNNMSAIPLEFGKKAISLKDITGESYDLEKIIHKILEKLNFYYDKVNNGKFEEQLPYINNYLYKKGEKVKLLYEGVIAEYKIIAVDEECRLIIEETNGRVAKLDMGEVL